MLEIIGMAAVAGAAVFTAIRLAKALSHLIDTA